MRNKENYNKWSDDYVVYEKKKNMGNRSIKNSDVLKTSKKKKRNRDKDNKRYLADSANMYFE